MSSSAQNRAIKNYRRRLRASGMARFEVLAPETDRDLIRGLAKKLAENGPEASRVRTIMRETVSSRSSKKGGVLAALRRSPLIGAELNLERVMTSGRKANL